MIGPLYSTRHMLLPLAAALFPEIVHQAWSIESVFDTSCTGRLAEKRQTLIKLLQERSVLPWYGHL